MSKGMGGIPGSRERSQSSLSPPVGFDRGRIENVVAKRVADRCHGKRKPEQAPERYAMIFQAARLGALETLRELETPNGN